MSLNAPIHMAQKRAKGWVYVTWCGLESELLNSRGGSHWRNGSDRYEAKSIYSWQTATCIHCLEAFKADSVKKLTALEARITNIISEFPKPQAVEAKEAYDKELEGL